MRISGFTFARNAVKLDYPLKEALESVLPVVDELVVAVAPGDPDDDTRGLVDSVGDPRIRIVDAVWDEARGERIYSDLTNLALDACTGDWCLYIQADEVLHEDDQGSLLGRCEQLLDDHRVQGLLFDYLHFFGDYSHLQTGHGWYQREIRVIRRGIGLRSVRDAQSFRHPDQRRIAVARSHARIFHYGWVRHPRFMQAKVRAFWSHRRGQAEAASHFGPEETLDYGPLGRLTGFSDTHPQVVSPRIAAMDWEDLLRLEDPPRSRRTRLHKDERLRNRVLTAFTSATGIDLNHTNHGRVLDV